MFHLEYKYSKQREDKKMTKNERGCKKMKKEKWEEVAKRISEMPIGDFEAGLLYGMSINYDTWKAAAKEKEEGKSA